MSKPLLTLTTAALLCGCGSGGTANDTQPVDDAQATATPLPVATPSPTLRNDAEVAASPSGAQAVKVLQRYYVAIVSGDYTKAYGLWDNNGAASGMNARQFASAFEPYSAYRADIGEPSDVKMQGSDRFVDVPIILTGTRSDSGAFRKEGRARLHQTASESGATRDAGESDWRIASIDFAASPAANATPVAAQTAVTRTLDCIDGSSFTARFDPQDRSVTISQQGRKIATLAGRDVASGVYYRGDDYVLLGKGDRVTFSQPDKAPVPCHAS
ncbi:MliC family protein [Stakelama sp. CBK3Z-3]|uniref:MliC family protein n=1 Tax=Stakelama flava TaxID=2860338 RepID=A0ABS6XLZ9_9SPHN|nr:MliC family protein [Stakelama flava]MBW4331233.1 MliC family protein [Stakelama flava]